MLRRKVRSKSVQTFLIISLGAILGANCRYWLGGWAAQRFGAAFPYGNLIINLSGSLILGLFMTLVTERFLVDPQWRLLVAIGFLGSYTTFSSYTYESLSLVLNGQSGSVCSTCSAAACSGAGRVIRYLVGTVDIMPAQKDLLAVKELPKEDCHVS